MRLQVQLRAQELGFVKGIVRPVLLLEREKRGTAEENRRPLVV